MKNFKTAKPFRALFAALLAAAALLPPHATAQQGAGTRVTQSGVSGGGGASAGGDIRVRGAVGQPATDRSEGGGYTVAGGSHARAAVTAAGTLQFNAAAYQAVEAGGAVTVVVTRAGAGAGSVSVTYSTVAGGTAAEGLDYLPDSGTLTFADGDTQPKAFAVQLLDDAADEPDETISLALSAPTGGASLGAPATAVLTIRDDDGAGPQGFQLSAPTYAVSESAGAVTVTVTRSGDLSAPASVEYATSDGTASERSDYLLALGTLRFAAGQAAQSFVVFITDDRLAEGTEQFNVTLSNPAGASLGPSASASVSVLDDSAEAAGNPLDETQFFVRQHYRDFLNREPDAAGLAFWTGEIEQCGADPQCREVKRINVSAAFFLSIEFQETGYFVYRAHRVAFNSGPGLKLRTFVADAQEIGRGVVVNQGEWQARLEANRAAYMDGFVRRPEFVAAYPDSLTAAQFVDALDQNTSDPRQPTSGGVLSQAEREDLSNRLQAGLLTRAQVLRAVADHPALRQRELNRAFVYLQYAGYLRRNPDATPDRDFSGYNFWLSKLNDFQGNFIRAEMVKAFLNSDEYRKRFGP